MKIIKASFLLHLNIIAQLLGINILFIIPYLHLESLNLYILNIFEQVLHWNIPLTYFAAAVRTKCKKDMSFLM